MTTIDERDHDNEHDDDAEIYRLAKCMNCNAVRMVSNHTGLCPECGR